MKKRFLTTFGFCTISIALSGCGCDSLIQDSGKALNDSWPQARELAENGLAIQTADGDMTVEEFRTSHGISTLSEEQAEFYLETLNEHEETIDTMINYSSEDK